MFTYPRIKDLREDRDFSQKAVAEILGEHLTTYQRWEQGVHEVPTHIVVELCKLYNVSADYVLGFTNEPKPLPGKREQKK